MSFGKETCRLGPGTWPLPSLQARMPEGKRMARYRADSAAYQAELINEMEPDQVRWAIRRIRMSRARP